MSICHLTTPIVESSPVLAKSDFPQRVAEIWLSFRYSLRSQCHPTDALGSNESMSCY